MSREYDTLADVYDFLVPEALLEPEGSAAAFAPVVAELPRGRAGPRLRVRDRDAGGRAGAARLRGERVGRERGDGRADARAGGEARRVTSTPRRALWEDLDGGPYDAVFCVGNSITHARDRRAALAAMRGVLRR